MASKLSLFIGGDIYSLFGSHIQYGTELWGRGNCVNQNNIQNLQNRSLRKITFKNSMILLTSLKILKLKDLLHLLFVLQIEQIQTLAKLFVTLKHCGDDHNYQKWASTKRSLVTRLYKTNTYGTHSAKYHCILDLKKSSLTSQKLTILIQNLNH